jgi:hypothetical protein
MATNQIYAIWSTPDLSQPFTVEMELWPTDTNCQPFTVAMQNRANLFLRAEDWTTKDSDGDGIPDWWIWKYYHDLGHTGTDPDVSGAFTISYDYAHGLDPSNVDKNGDRRYDQRFSVHIFSPQ